MHAGKGSTAIENDMSDGKPPDNGTADQTSSQSKLPSTNTEESDDKVKSNEEAAEKFPTPSTVQKKDLLHQKLSQKDQDLRQAQDKLRAADRQIKGLNTQLSEIKRSRRDISNELEELKEKLAAKEAAPTAAPSLHIPEPVRSDSVTLPGNLEAPTRELGDEHEALAAKLLEEGLKLDLATLAAAAAGLRDTSVLESQLKRTREDALRLQTEIQQLNDTVFSKSFKPPSAWADREVKYKMEKRAWEQQVAGLKEQIKRLTAENKAYRDDNKAEEFEAQIKVLKASVAAADAEKTSAQQEAHDLQLKMRELQARRLSPRESHGPENASVHNKILHMEDKSQGSLAPAPSIHNRRASLTQLPAGVIEGSISSGASDKSADGNAADRADLQDVIDNFDEQGIRMTKPLRKKRSRKEKPEAFRRVAADADGSANESIGYDSSADVDPNRQDGQIGEPISGSEGRADAEASLSQGSKTSAGNGVLGEEAATAIVSAKSPSAETRLGNKESAGLAAAEESQKDGPDATDQRPTTRSVPVEGDANSDAGAATRRSQANVASQEIEQDDPLEEKQDLGVRSGPSVIHLATDLAGSESVIPDSRIPPQDAKERAVDAQEPAAVQGAELDRTDSISKDEAVPPDTVRNAAISIGEEEKGPMPASLQRATSSHPAAYVADTGAAKLTLPSDIADQRQIDQLSGGRLLATGQKQSSDDHATEIIPLHSAEQGDRDSRNGHTDYGSLEGGPQIDAGSTADADRETDTATRAGGSPTFSPPASPFATADTGHLTGDGADAGSAAPLKGAAAAVAMARRKSMAESEPSDASDRLEGQPDSAKGSQEDLSWQRLQIQTRASQRRSEPLAGAKDSLLTRNSSEADSPWTQEKLSALQAEKDAVEEELLEHMADQDVKQLKFKAALMESRVEMHEAQMTKMQKALEKADQEKARVEEDLEVALRAMHSVKNLDTADQQKLHAIRERIQQEASSTAESYQSTKDALQESYREVQLLQKQRDSLQKQLSDIAAKINSGMIPNPEDFDLPEAELQGDSKTDSVSEPATIKAVRSLRQYNSFVEGLTEEEIEVMALRQENENVMDTLVRTKVELAETQGDYLKMRRALIRAVEKHAAVSDRLDSIKYAVAENDFARAIELAREQVIDYTQHSKRLGGDIESLGERDVF